MVLLLEVFCYIDEFFISWLLKHLQLHYLCESTYEWKLKIKALWLWVRGRQFSQNAYFLCSKCQVEFSHHGARKPGGQCTLELDLKFFLLRNTLLSANFRIAHLGPWLSSMTSQRRLASLKFAMKKFTIFGQIWPALILILCGKIISRKRRLDKLFDIYCFIMRFQKRCLLWPNN